MQSDTETNKQTNKEKEKHHWNYIFEDKNKFLNKLYKVMLINSDKFEKELNEIEIALSNISIHGARYPEQLEKMTGL